MSTENGERAHGAEETVDCLSGKAHSGCFRTAQQNISPGLAALVIVKKHEFRSHQGSQFLAAPTMPMKVAKMFSVNSERCLTYLAVCAPG